MKQKRRILHRHLISLALLLVFLFPVLSLANPYLPLIQCGHKDASGVMNTCDFNDAVDTINRIINWIISLAGVIFTVSAVWGGFLYLASGTSLGDKERAKKILWNSLLGFVIILSAWLIIFTLLNALVAKNAPGDSIFRFIGGKRN
jgi:hypothetical protein